MQKPITKNKKITIIGAGAAGIHLAYLLKKNGYHHVKLIEKSDRANGKIMSIFHNQTVHEMGACYFGATYSRLMDLMQELNVTDFLQVKTNQRKSILKNARQMMTSDWLWNQVDYVAPVRMPFNWMRNTLNFLFLTKNIFSFNRRYPDFFNSSPYDIPSFARFEQRKNLAQPVSEFLKTQRLKMLLPVFVLMNSTQCYGYPKSTPTYYGLYWMNAEFLKSYLKFVLNIGNPIIMGMLKSGYESLWNEMGKTVKDQVILNAQVQKITRGEKTVIFYEKEGQPYQEETDVLIFAMPGKESLTLMETPSALEKEIFADQIVSKVVTRLVEIENPRISDGIVYWLHCLSIKYENEVYAMRNADAIFNNKNESKQTVVTYQYYENEKTFSQSRADQYFHNSLSSRGIQVKNILQQKTWNYFPRFTSDAIAAGTPWKIDQLQSQQSTFFTGSSVSFESINAIMNYNHYLIDSYFKH